ncbi:hypothetical protein CMV_021814 [Castanea mollissima]|uniref:Uncharacterized protein n=1 Tax=Castanea mollissima TaxID=60419 RepID=A0A8J4QNC4_9ROSI|nr:hypothetical protein CMV_021814 [Castanea mollissima]
MSAIPEHWTAQDRRKFFVEEFVREWRSEQALLKLKAHPFCKGYQCSVVIEGRYLAAKAKVKKLSNNNEDLLNNIFDVMNKVFESKNLRSKAEENTKATTDRKEALKKELQEMKKTLEDKSAELKAFVADNEKIQAAYYQGQYNCIANMKPKV